MPISAYLCSILSAVFLPSRCTVCYKTTESLLSPKAPRDEVLSEKYLNDFEVSLTQNRPHDSHVSLQTPLLTEQVFLPVHGNENLAYT